MSNFWHYYQLVYVLPAVALVVVAVPIAVLGVLARSHPRVLSVAAGIFAAGFIWALSGLAWLVVILGIDLWPSATVEHFDGYDKVTPAPYWNGIPAVILIFVGFAFALAGPFTALSSLISSFGKGETPPALPGPTAPHPG
ncbi:MAG: hypothetical protein ACXWZ1_10815 [Gaiellaceae bacterium]